GEYEFSPGAITLPSLNMGTPTFWLNARYFETSILLLPTILNDTMKLRYIFLLTLFLTSAHAQFLEGFGYYPYGESPEAHITMAGIGSLGFDGAEGAYPILSFRDTTRLVSSFSMVHNYKSAAYAMIGGPNTRDLFMDNAGSYTPDFTVRYISGK